MDRTSCRESPLVKLNKTGGEVKEVQDRRRFCMPPQKGLGHWRERSEREGSMMTHHLGMMEDLVFLSEVFV